MSFKNQREILEALLAGKSVIGPSGVPEKLNEHGVLISECGTVCVLDFVQPSRWHVYRKRLSTVEAVQHLLAGKEIETEATGFRYRYVGSAVQFRRLNDPWREVAITAANLLAYEWYAAE